MYIYKGIQTINKYTNQWNTYQYFSEQENCIHVARLIGFLIWIGIPLTKGLISCNWQISENQGKSNMIDQCLGVHFPRRYFPQRVGQRTSQNGFGARVVMFERKSLVSERRCRIFHCTIWCKGYRFLFYAASLQDFLSLLQSLLIQ